MKYFLVAFVWLCYACKPKQQPLSRQNGFTVLDTLTTPDNWKISWLTDADSANAWIVCTKDHKTVQFIDSQVLLINRTDFVPYYKTETPFVIYMPYRCATDCEGMLIFSKQALAFKMFSNMVSYDTLTDKLVNISRDSYQDNIFKVSVTDLKTLQDTTIVFKNLALGSSKAGYIDTVQYTPTEVMITTTLQDANDDSRTRMVRERKKIRF